MVKSMGRRNVCPYSNKLSVNSWSNSKPNCPRASVARAGTFTNVNMPSVQKFDEQVIEMAAEELVHNLDSGGRDELRRIEKALERLSEGTYGVCTSCGKDIPVPRLEAVPYAEECIDCAATDTE